MIESLDISSLRSGYASGQFHPSDVVMEVYDRIARNDPAIWISLVSRERALERAESLENEGARESRPLWGIPFAIKDNIDAAGVPTTAACPGFAYTPQTSARVVELLEEAGAILVGKTNLDQFATGLVGTRSPYGIPRNAVAPGYVPGGSSSGSAVAVASGLVSFSLGTDTAGSGRVPAAFNNIVGFKPTRGWLSTRGVVPACRTLDCVSIFGLTVADAVEITRIIGCYDAGDACARRAPEEKTFRPARRVFAVPLPGQLEFFGDYQSAAAFEASLAKLKALGWEERRIDFTPFIEAARLLYEGPWAAERYAAIRPFIERSPGALHPVTRGIIEKARAASAVDCFEAGYRLAELKGASEAVWETADLLVTPTAGTIFTIEQVEADPVRLNSSLGYYTNYVNLLDLCAVAVPAGFTSGGLPFGITIVAPAFTDSEAARLADAFHRCQDLRLGATETALRETPALAIVEPSSVCELAVCGAHLRGLPLHHQLEELGARLVEATHTAPSYRLYALPGTTPPKPGMVRDTTGSGAAIEIEIYALSAGAFGRFVHAIPPPLGIGKIETASGRFVSGFLCEASAITAETEEVTRFGGWRAYLGAG